MWRMLRRGWLEAEGANGWFDLLGGQEDTAAAVQRVVKDGVNTIEGEDIGVMKAKFGVKKWQLSINGIYIFSADPSICALTPITIARLSDIK